MSPIAEPAAVSLSLFRQEDPLPERLHIQPRWQAVLHSGGGGQRQLPSGQGAGGGAASERTKCA